MKTNIKIEGMHCNSCAALLTDVLSDLKGVKEANVNFEKKEAHVEYNPKEVNELQMKKAIEAEGYKAK